MNPILLNAGPSERGWHRIESAARCLRLFAWEQAGKLGRVETEPLIKGSLLHIGLAQYYARMQAEQEGNNPNAYFTPEEGVRELSRQEIDRASPEGGKIWEASVSIVLSSLKEYMYRWGDHHHWRIVMVEKQLKATIKSPSGNSFLFTQRPDLIIQDQDKKYWIVDHKSCYRIVGRTLQQHILSGQFLGYMTFGKAKYGRDFGGCVVNRVKLSSPHAFDRSTVEPAPSAIRNFTKMLGQTEDIVAQFEGKDVMEWPATYSDQTCYGKYGQCPAFDLCRWGE